MATKKQIAQIMKSAIDEATSNPLNMKPPTLEDMYEHALGVKLGEATKAQMHKERLEASAKINTLFKQLENIESIPIRIAKAMQATQSGSGDNCKPPKTRKRIKHIPYKQALAILERLNCPKDRKTLLRWMKGENTPDGFTPETMATVPFFTAWAKIYANREQSKINTNNTLRIDNPNSRKMQKFR